MVFDGDLGDGMLKRLNAAIIVTAIVAAAVPALACIVRRADLAEAAERSDALVVARVASSKELTPASGAWGKTVEHAVVITETLGGAARPGPLRMTFSQPRPHRRGDTMVCPLLLGSGIEYELSGGQTYLLLLSKTRLVRAMPLAERRAAEQAWAAR